MTKVIDTLTQEDIHGAFQKLLEQYDECIAARGDYFEVERLSCVYYQIYKSAHTEKSGNLLNDTRRNIGRERNELAWDDLNNSSRGNWIEEMNFGFKAGLNIKLYKSRISNRWIDNEGLVDI